MEKEFIFIDENDDDKKKVFYRQLYYQYIKKLISDFFKKELNNNDTHLRFVNFLETLEDSGDVYFITSEFDYHWVICIIYDTLETAEIEKDIIARKILEKHSEFCESFLKENSIIDFIEEEKNRYGR
jgi:hypothetical protein